jgi:hypothetical protein
MKSLNTAIVILNWNGEHFLRKFLPGVIACSKGIARIVIADNDSSDDSLKVLSEFGDDIEVIKLDKNYGFTGGYNRALKLVDAEYYVLLNSDVEVTTGWIEPIINFMTANADVAACQPKIRSYADRHLFEHAGASGGYIDWLGYPFCRGRLFLSLEEDHQQYNSTTEIFWATGACMFVRASVFHQMNGFDEEFFAHMEEIDLCWRMQIAGYKIMSIPESEVYHVGGGTLPKTNPRKTFYNFRNNLMMLQKNLPGHQAWVIIPIRLVLDGVAGVKFMLDGDFSDTLAVIKAHFAFYASIPKRLKIRKEIQQNLHNSKFKGVYHGSILKAYYLKGLKHFSQLNQQKFS